MTLLDMTPYITGDLFTRECASPVRCTPSMLAKAVAEAEVSETFNVSIKYIESYQDFVMMEPDIGAQFPKSEREEIFYCLKNKGYSPAVPARCIYVMKTLYEKYGSASIALKALNKNLFTIFFQKNYMDGYTMRDVIKTFCDPEYEPFTVSRLRVQHKDYDEVYIASTDMVALLPKPISQRIQDVDIPKIIVTKYGLELDGYVLRQLAGYYGAVNSTYDLRGLI